MAPTINPNLIDNNLDNDEIQAVLKCYKNNHDYKVGDIIAFSSEFHDSPLIKRIIAVGGQKVTINFKKWKIWVNGVLLDESSYLIKGKNYFPETDMQSGTFKNSIEDFTVDDGKVFVMGDNRQFSLDSRFDAIGQVKKENIVGIVTEIINNPSDSDQSLVKKD